MFFFYLSLVFTAFCFFSSVTSRGNWPTDYPHAVRDLQVCHFVCLFDATDSEKYDAITLFNPLRLKRIGYWSHSGGPGLNMVSDLDA